MDILTTGFLGETSATVETDFATLSIVRYPKPVSEDWHCHDRIHLSLILQGGNLEARKGEELQATPGTILLYPEGEQHRNRYTLFPSKNLNLEIEPVYLQKEDISFTGFEDTRTQDPDTLFTLLSLYHELHIHDVCTPDSIRQSLLALFSEKEQLTRHLPSWLQSLKALLLDRWNEFVALDELAEQTKVHPVTISRYFRKHFRCTLGDFMRKIKLEKAVYLILNTQKSLTEIAYECGFSDQSHFIRVCKVYIGVNPNTLRAIRTDKQG